MPFKFKIYHTLPIILALIMPSLSMFGQQSFVSPSQFDPIARWIFASVFLYVLWYLLLPIWKFEHKQREWIFFLVAIVSILVFVLLFQLYAVEPYIYRWHLTFRMMMATVLFFTIQYALFTQRRLSSLLVEKEQLQTENYRVQLKALQNKVDPHFLFNSLNTLRSMVRQKHTNSEEFIISLADFYRQTLKHNEDSTLSLKEELLVLDAYLFLMKNRNEKAVSITLDIDHELYGHRVPTLGLQAVVENCFKHNSMTVASPLSIQISTTDNMCIQVINNLQPKITTQELSGYGLDLLEKRFALLGVANALSVKSGEGSFCVTMKLLEP